MSFLLQYFKVCLTSKYMSVKAIDFIKRVRSSDNGMNMSSQRIKYYKIIFKVFKNLS